MMKNKYLEAFDKINYFMNVTQIHKKLNYDEQEELVQAELTILELIDKENPRKVVFEPNGSPIKSARCPKCNGLIHFGFETYCCYCGTKLSWE